MAAKRTGAFDATRCAAHGDDAVQRDAGFGEQRDRARVGVLRANHRDARWDAEAVKSEDRDFVLVGGVAGRGIEEDAIDRAADARPGQRRMRVIFARIDRLNARRPTRRRPPAKPRRWD